MANSFSLWKHSGFWLGVLKCHWFLSMSGSLPFLRPMSFFTSRTFSCHFFDSSPILLSSSKYSYYNGTYQSSLGQPLRTFALCSEKFQFTHLIISYVFFATQSIKWFCFINHFLTFKNAGVFFSFQDFSFHNNLYFSGIHYICLCSFTWLTIDWLSLFVNEGLHMKISLVTKYSWA